MSVNLTKTAWDMELPDPTQKLILMSIADQANDEWRTAWPSVAFIARRTGVSARTVQRHLKELVRAGHLGIEERRNNSSIYTIFPRGDNLSGVSSVVATPDAHDTSGGDAHVTQTIIETPKNHMSLFEGMVDPVQSPLNEIEREFKAWWNDEYPERHGQNSRKKAFEFYCKHRKTVTKEAIWAATLAYFNQLLEDETPPKFVKMATSFLNSEPWND